MIPFSLITASRINLLIKSELSSLNKSSIFSGLTVILSDLSELSCVLLVLELYSGDLTLGSLVLVVYNAFSLLRFEFSRVSVLSLLSSRIDLSPSFVPVMLVSNPPTKSLGPRDSLPISLLLELI